MGPMATPTTIQLTENETRRVSLPIAQAALLARTLPELSVRPVLGEPGLFDLWPDGIAGQVDVGDVSLRIASKVPLGSLLFMLAYSVDTKHWKSLHTSLSSQDSLLDAIALVYARELSNAFRQGLVRSYRSTEDVLQIAKGKLRTHEQIRKRFGRMPPIECQLDEFTEDILENRLIRAALWRMRHLRIRNPQARIQLRHAEAQLENVEALPLTARDADSVVFTRLNERLRLSIALSRLILSSTSVANEDALAARGSGFILKVYALFETFIVTALREHLSRTRVRIPTRKVSIALDEGARFRLVPDLTFYQGDSCIAVGDVKYKRTPASGANNPDVYQVLAYAKALCVSETLLVYPKDEDNYAGTHTIRNTGERLQVVGLDLNQSPEDVLRELAAVASRLAAATGRWSLTA